MKKSLFWLPVLMLFINSCGKELEFNTPPNTVTTNVVALAGSGTAGAVNGTGINASFYQPAGMVVDASGNIYVADAGNNLIREITPAGVVTTFAGNVAGGSVNSTGTLASFNQPTGLAIDAAGNIYVADNGNNLIREISPAGVVTTLAGSTTAGAVNGTGTAASFSNPEGIAIDASGNLYVADYTNNLIRKIAPGGVVTTFAGNGNTGAADSAGTSASFNNPSAIVADASGNLYVADYGNDKIRKITPAGAVSSFAGSGNTGSADGTGAAASFNGITGLAIDGSGNLYVADYGNNIIRIISPAGVVTTLRSGGSTGKTLIFDHPYDVALDAAGNIYISDYGNATIQKITK